ncbi:hypothetical protein [uncultured Aquimarina sp.]|uniref:hypothetical protein n=1 Tax=uncultured Aquimarina sp. TaxID=575652 RepID=UPI002616401D|nr:hypothetical protein [uncultured Aquimarina sp.]
MILFKPTTFLLLFCTIFGYSKEINLSQKSDNQSLIHILKTFENEHQFNFSYDVEAIKNVLLNIPRADLSISSLQGIIEFQTSFLLEKVSETDYIGTNHTIYSEYKYKTPKTYINIGVRGSQVSNTNSFFVEPRMFSSYELWDNFTLNSSAELKNQ